jgi:hypothetical protein
MLENKNSPTVRYVNEFIAYLNGLYRGKQLVVDSRHEELFRTLLDTGMAIQENIIASDNPYESSYINKLNFLRNIEKAHAI